MKYSSDSERCPELEQVLQEIINLLAAMSREERMAWFKRTMYEEPVSFIREIDGTVYAVRSLFEPDAKENIAEKVNRILSKQRSEN